MCLLVLAWQAHPRYRLVVAANRDEFHARPAAPLAKWPPPAGMLAGRDLQAQGTWLGLDRARRFGVVTNFRELQRPQPGGRSRGGLIPRYLAGSDDAAALLRRARARGGAATPASTCCSPTPATLWYGSNRAAPFARALPPGIYGLSNELLDTPWPKLTRVRAGFEAWLQTPAAAPAGLFSLLADRTPAPQAQTDTGGLPPEWARALSAPFVLHPRYGTRCSSVLLLGAAGELRLIEQRFDRRRRARRPTTSSRCSPGEWP